MREASRIPLFQGWIDHIGKWLEGDVGDIEEEMTRVGVGFLKIQHDPEAIFQQAWMLCDVGQHERGLVALERAVARGYFVAATLAGRPQFDALRDNPRFRAVLGAAEAGRAHALAVFREAGGERLLGASA
jgi:hypothetical protein